MGEKNISFISIIFSLIQNFLIHFEITILKLLVLYELTELKKKNKKNKNNNLNYTIFIKIKIFFKI
jgi:hypothetical protein